MWSGSGFVRVLGSIVHLSAKDQGLPIIGPIKPKHCSEDVP